MRNEREFEVRVTEALERRPVAAVPQDFAAKVMVALPPLKKRRKPVQVGRTMAIAAAMVSLLTMFALAPHAVASFTNLAFDVELLLMVELAGIAWGFSKAGSRQ